ncbi:hypothetical protein GQX73_g7741 [Xylaria multiplex]|uniref:Uncharacterized protein n=1 Tax=Xylaria multiplex TaxID=323545 RepID=A0A7C8IT47_9PEZI|nr:hypothetical protein GQX73_g7741 [Xylaria multiplex]
MPISKFMCIQCTRRLSHLAQSSKALNSPILPQHTPQRGHRHSPLLSTRSPYSTASSRTVAKKLTTRDAFAKVRFTRADVPPRGFWDAQARAPLVTDLSADECLHAAQAYADAALKDNSGWREQLIVVNDDSTAWSSDGKGKGKTLSAYTLYYVAVMIMMSPPGPVSYLATHILNTLVGLRYTPSILTMVRLALNRRMVGQPQFEPAFEELERILRRIGDGSSSKSISKDTNINLAADACTLRALLYAEENTREGDNNALRWFRRAYEIDTTSSESRIQPTPTAGQTRLGEKRKEDVNSGSEEIKGARFNPYWQWKVSFALGVAAIRMKRGETGKARGMYEVASSELDNAAGYLGLATILEKMGETDTDKYIESLEKAAVSGDLDAARMMGMRERSRAVERGLNKREKRKRQVIAEEWMSIANSTVLT